MKLRQLILGLQRHRLFRRPEPFTSPGQLILWWELRRIPYNLIVGFTGVVTCISSVLLIVLPEAAAQHKAVSEVQLGSPFLGVISILVYGVAANVCYTAGWSTELLVKLVWGDRAKAYGEIVFTLGLLFSVGLTLLPLLVVLGLMVVKAL